MAATFVPVIDENGIVEVAKMADVIWHEHYAGIVENDGIDYIVEHYQSVEAITEAIHNNGYDYFKLGNGTSDVGYFAIKIEGDDLFISKLYVLKEFRKQGYGKQVFQFLKGLSEAMAIKTITLMVNQKNIDSIAVYETFGMKKIDSVQTDFGGGFICEDYKMQMTL